MAAIVEMSLHLRLLIDSFTELGHNIRSTTALVPGLGTSHCLVWELDLNDFLFNRLLLHQS